MAPSRRSTLALLACLAAGAALRLWMIGKDIPFSIGIDEPDLTTRALTMVKTGSLSPHWFDYPTLAIYAQAIVIVARFLAGTLSAEWRSLNQVSPADFYLWVRVATAMMGVLTIYVVYRVALRWGAVTAIVAAAVMAVQPWHVRESHRALTDVPLTLCVAVTMLASLRASEEGRRRWFALAGAAAGLAAATKYNGLFVVIMPLTRSLMAPAGRRGSFVMATIGGAAAAFLIGAPYTILDLPGFLNGFAELSQHFNHGGRGWSEAAAIYIKHFNSAMSVPGGATGALGWLAAAFGWIALAVGVSGLVMMAWRTRRSAERPTALGAVLFATAYFWLICHSSGQLFARYALPLVPVLCVGLGVGTAAALEAVARRVSGSGLRRAASTAVVALAIVPPLLTSVLWDRDQAKVSIARITMDWMEAHVQPTDRIVVETHGFLPPAPRFRCENVERLIDRSIDDYRADGTVYLVAIAEEFNKFMDNPRTPQDLSARAAYETIFRATEEVARFTAGPHNEHPGSEIRILRIPR